MNTNSTIQRFKQYSSQEEAVFNRFLNHYLSKSDTKDIAECLSNYEVHPNETEDYDIGCITHRGYITFDIQESQDFPKYGDLRIDYISAFRPPSFYTKSLEDFENALSDGRVTVDKWGKVVNPKADFLLVEFQNGIIDWGIYNLLKLHKYLSELRNISFFGINRKRYESWGSAFLAVSENHPIVQKTRVKSLDGLFK